MIDMRHLSDEGLVELLREYARNFGARSKQAANQYEALADRIETLCRDRDAWKCAAEALGPRGFPKRRHGALRKARLL